MEDAFNSVIGQGVSDSCERCGTVGCMKSCFIKSAKEVFSMKIFFSFWDFFTSLDPVAKIFLFVILFVIISPIICGISEGGGSSDSDCSNCAGTFGCY